MSDDQISFREGGCQCGHIRYRVTGQPLRVALCYCQECQRHSGSAFSMNMIVRDSDFEIVAGSVKRFSRAADSGRTVECAFCPECGTRILHLPEFAPGIVNVKAGTLDDASDLRPAVEVFAKRKPGWLSVADLKESHQGQR
jgi:hypothetical protein